LIVGPSGSGKTTLLKLLAQLIQHANIHTPKIKGTFWQEYNLLPLNAKENINLPFLNYNITKNISREKKLIDYFNVINFLNTNVENLS
jgi:ABC-type lipoprotein export system ATPase subunit